MSESTPKKVTDDELAKIWNEYVIPYIDMDELRHIFAIAFDQIPVEQQRKSDWEVLLDAQVLKWIPPTWCFPGG